MIPKIIHYCWFGGGPMPKDHQRYVDRWQDHLHEYKIIRWDENNSPMHLPYMQTALSNRKWANLSNYTRLHALYEHGGIYLDTDIEVLKSFEPLLQNKCFVGFESIDVKELNCVNNAVFGAVPNHPFVQELQNKLLNEYDGREEANWSSPVLTTNLLREKGLKMYGQQFVSDIQVYPTEYFYPYSWRDTFNKECIKENTYCIHHWKKSWEEKKEPEKLRVRVINKIMKVFK